MIDQDKIINGVYLYNQNMGRFVQLVQILNLLMHNILRTEHVYLYTNKIINHCLKAEQYKSLFSMQKNNTSVEKTKDPCTKVNERKV